MASKKEDELPAAIRELDIRELEEGDGGETPRAQEIEVQHVAADVTIAQVRGYLARKALKYWKFLWRKCYTLQHAQGDSEENVVMARVHGGPWHHA